MISNTASTVTTQHVAPEQSRTDFRDVWSILRRRKWLIVFGILLGLGLASLYYFTETPMYESSVTMLVVPKNSSFSQIQGNSSQDSLQHSMQEDVLSTQIELFQSPRVIHQAVESADLTSLPTFTQAVEEGQNPIFYISQQLEVGKGGQGRARDASVLQASFRSPHPQDSQKVIQALVDSYQAFLKSTFRDTSSEALELIRKAKDELHQELMDVEKQYQSFRETSPLIRSEGDRNIHQVRLSKLENTLSEIMSEHTEAQARLEVIATALGDNDKLNDLSLLALLSDKDKDRLQTLVNLARGDQLLFQAEAPVRSEVARAEYERVLESLLQLNALRQRYGPDHPQVRGAEQQIATIKEFLNSNRPEHENSEVKRLDPRELLTAYIEFLEHDLNDLAKRREDLENLALQEEAAAKSLTVYEIKDDSYKKNMERKSDLYELVIDRLRQVNLVRDYGGYLTEVLSPPGRASEPAWPKLPLVLALGTIVGAAFGVGLAWAVDLADRTFRSPDELCHALELPIMSHLPALSQRSTTTAAAVEGNGGPRIDHTVVAHSRPKGRNAEAFRGLRTCLLFSAHGQGHKVIQITSPNPGDGKTTVAANLGASIAQTGKSVLLVDCDFRRPRLAKLLGVEADLGLASLLRNDDVELLDLIQSTEMENLSVLPCGKRPNNPAELLALPRFAQVIETLRAKFDFVLVDTPPVLAVSDPSIVAGQVDGVMLIVRITKNGRPQTIRAKDMLSSLESEMLGVVVNGVTEDRNKTYSYGYASRYGYRYNYDSYRYSNRYRYGYGYGYGYGEENGGNTYLEKDEKVEQKEHAEGQDGAR